MNQEQLKVWREEERHAWNMGKYEQKLTEQGINTARPVHRIAYLAGCEARQEEYEALKKDFYISEDRENRQHSMINEQMQEIQQLKKELDEAKCQLDVKYEHGHPEKLRKENVKLKALLVQAKPWVENLIRPDIGSVELEINNWLKKVEGLK